MWNLKKKKKRKIQRNLFTNRNRPTDIENYLMVIKVERGGGGINQEVGINMYTTVYKIDNQQGPTV